MKSGQVVGGMLAGSVLGAAIGYMVRPRNKAMSLMRKGIRKVRW
ncbi:hypothetical protein [Desulfitobacterium sp.]|nr:hypothetical protein [Desulfitobacterium sp.]HVJ50465.1 hypothetical protein [Desulfitobacterium sp.]